MISTAGEPAAAPRVRPCRGRSVGAQQQSSRLGLGVASRFGTCLAPGFDRELARDQGRVPDDGPSDACWNLRFLVCWYEALRLGARRDGCSLHGIAD